MSNNQPKKPNTGGKNFLQLPLATQKRILGRAVDEANKSQLELEKTYIAKFGDRSFSS
jgi:hypothetical protein